MLIVNISNRAALEALQMQEKRLAQVARAGAIQAAKLARKYAPKKTGKLRRGIIVMPGIEHSRFVGKAVAEVVMDPAMNDVFQKSNPKGHHYYYPASQEYGFKRRVRGGGTKHVPGKHFMHVASRLEATDMEQRVTELVEDVLGSLEG